MKFATILVLLVPVVSSLVNAQGKIDQVQNITTVIIGEAGTGKSTLANVLLGRPFNSTGGPNGCFSGHSHMMLQNGPYTTSPCRKSSFFLGNSSNLWLTVVDTPGFGFSGDVDDYTIKVLVEYLKNEVRSTNSFLLLFNGLEKRFTRTTLHWLTSIQNIFGSEIWSYAIIGVSHWGYSMHEKEVRARTHPKVTTQSWSLEVNLFLQERFHISRDLPVVFIDARADMKDSHERVGFVFETRQFMTIASGLAKKDVFMFRDIDTVRSELSDLNYTATKLQRNIAFLEQKLLNLTQANKERVYQQAVTKNPLIRKEEKSRECQISKSAYQYSEKSLVVAALSGLIIPVIAVAIYILIQSIIGRCDEHRPL